MKLYAGALALAAVGAGCSGGSGSTATAPTNALPTNASSTVSTEATTQPPASGLDLLRKVALRDTDLPAGLRFRLLPEGDTVVNQVTLDLCGANFPSERARTARLQQAAVGADRKLIVNNENVLYRSPDRAAAAFDEIRNAVATCPARTFVLSKVAGVPPLRYGLHLVPDGQLAGVAPDHVAFEGTVTDQKGTSASHAAVFQRRGLVMVAIYGPDLATIRGLLSVGATRLAALSPGEAVG